MINLGMVTSIGVINQMMEIVVILLMIKIKEIGLIYVK